MNIELQVKMLYANADKLDEAGFVADFYYIAKEYARQQLLQQTPCTTLLPGCQAHYFVQKDQNWLSCAHCGMQKPIGQ